MTIEIREVASKSELKTFIEYPQKLYKGNPYYVPSLYFDEMNTLTREKNPAFKTAKAHLWMAFRDGELVGRIAGIHIPAHQQKWGVNLVRFGWFDLIDNPEVAAALLGKVEAWARELGAEGVHGPLGFTDLDREGMLVEGFEELATLATNYNYPYYSKLVEGLGFVKDIDWVSNEIHLVSQFIDKIEKTAALVSKRYELHLFKGTKKQLYKIAPQIFEVIDEAYRKLYGTVPLNEEQVKWYVDQYFGFAQLKYLPVIMDKDNRVVAFGITFPSFSKALRRSKGKLFPFGFIHFLWALTFNDTADLYLEGVRDEYRGKGLNGMMMNEIYKSFIRSGVKKVETNLTLETNNDVQVQWKYFEARQHKRHRIYIKKFA
jgi:GNAT superfamily N-acetyltransferase